MAMSSCSHELAAVTCLAHIDLDFLNHALSLNAQEPQADQLARLQRQVTAALSVSAEGPNSSREYI